MIAKTIEADKYNPDDYPDWLEWSEELERSYQADMRMNDEANKKAVKDLWDNGPRLNRLRWFRPSAAAFARKYRKWELKSAIVKTAVNDASRILTDLSTFSVVHIVDIVLDAPGYRFVKEKGPAAARLYLRALSRELFCDADPFAFAEAVIDQDCKCRVSQFLVDNLTLSEYLGATDYFLETLQKESRFRDFPAVVAAAEVWWDRKMLVVDRPTTSPRANQCGLPGP